MSFIFAACVFTASAQAGTIEIPADEIGWVADRDPFETPRAVRAFFHNPAVLSATGLAGVEIDVRQSGGEDYYELRLMPAPDAGRLTGKMVYAVDGAAVATKTVDMMGGSGGDDTPLVKAMAAGERLTITLPDEEEVSLALAGLAEALSPADANADQAGVMRATSIGNQCVQREGGFNYLCACISHEYVMAYGDAGPAQAFDAAEAKCRANIKSNSLLGELTVQEALLGARLEAANDPAGGARIGALSKGGPSYAVGMRTGDIITKVGSTPGERLLQAKPVRPGVKALTVYSPSTKETRVVRVPYTLPPADIEMKPHAQFNAENHAREAAADTQPAAPAGELQPAPAAPVAEKVSYADPIGERCANGTLTNNLYDCACIAEKAVPIRSAIADERFEDQKPYIPRQINIVELMRKRLEEAATEKEKQSFARGLEKAEARLAELKARPDPSDIDVSVIGLRAYKDKSCKLDGYVREQEKTSCLAAAARMSGVTDAESFCSCSAGKVAAAWLASDDAYSSSLQVSMATQARQACR